MNKLSDLLKEAKIFYLATVKDQNVEALLFSVGQDPVKLG